MVVAVAVVGRARDVGIVGGRFGPDVDRLCGRTDGTAGVPLDPWVGVVGMLSTRIGLKEELMCWIGDGIKGGGERHSLGGGVVLRTVGGLLRGGVRGMAVGGGISK